MRRISVVLALGVALAACGSGGGNGPSVSEARIGEPTGPNAALYVTIESDQPDRLLAVSTDVAGTTELHETTTGDDGTMSMTPVEAFEVGPGDALVLEPGGKHVMLLDVDRLAVGDEVSVTLEFENADSLTVDVPVVGVIEVLGDDHDHHDH